MGMTLVAFFAASAADPAGATIKSTLRRTRSAARSGSRSRFPSAHRYSMMRFGLRPSRAPVTFARMLEAPAPRTRGWGRSDNRSGRPFPAVAPRRRVARRGDHPKHRQQTFADPTLNRTKDDWKSGHITPSWRLRRRLRPPGLADKHRWTSAMGRNGLRPVVAESGHSHWARANQTLEFSDNDRLKVKTARAVAGRFLDWLRVLALGIICTGSHLSNPNVC